MAYKVIILYRLYMPSYFLGTFTEYPSLGAIIRLSLGTTMVRWAVESLFMLVTSPFVVKYT